MDGSLLATSGSDATAKIWRLDQDSGSGYLLTTLSGQSNTVLHTAFSPDDDTLVTGGLVAGGGEEVRLWDLSLMGQNQDAGNAVPELFSLPGGSGLALSPDGKTLIAGFSDGSFRSYILDLNDLLVLARSRLTRTWTAEECRQYRIDPCPAGP
jgi:WD40 repeat protein